VKEFYLIAKITSITKKGFVKIFSYSDFPERFFHLKKVYIDLFGSKKKLLVESVVKVKNSFELKFKGFDSKPDLHILVGKEVFVDEENLIKLPENYFFIHDLIGSHVLKDNVEVGILKDVLSYPANDVYILENSIGEEILIPAVKEFVDKFDPEKKILVLKSGINLYDDDED
jgi:16S rRNA processing protein RimM